MGSRRVILVAGTVVALSAVAAAAGQASPARAAYQLRRGSTESPLTKAPGPPTTNRYAVKIIARLAANSGAIAVSSNGKWAVTDTDHTDGPTIQLINVAKAKIEGTTTDTTYGQYPVGVDNAGIVYGTAIVPDLRDGAGTIDDGFLWDGHTVTDVPLPGNLASTCSDNKPSSENLTFQSVNASGVAVGQAGWTCKADNNGGGGAIMYSPLDGVEFTGDYHDSSDVLRHPSVAYTIDDANIVSGVLTTTVTGEVEWRNGVDAAPQPIAASVGEPAVYPPTTNALWQNSDFVGSLQPFSKPSDATVELFHGGQGKETVTTVPEGAGASDDGYRFTPTALDPKELVVGDRITLGNQATAPAVWSVGSSVTPLTSLLVSPTKDHLLSAMAIDVNGDIFGTASMSTAKNAPLYLYETVVSHPAPTVRLTSPKNGEAYKKGATLKASFTCQAGKSEKLQSCKGTEPDHHKVSTKKTGQHSFTVTATDTDGQKTKKTVHFTVKK